jgi:hypothetical protein
VGNGRRAERARYGVWPSSPRAALRLLLQDSSGLQESSGRNAAEGVLQNDHDQAITAQARAIRAWTALGESEASRSWVENPTEFQTAYVAARRRRELGEAPVPYVLQDAMGGIDRPFGVEIEFDIDGYDISERNERLLEIGNALYDAGLTRYRTQQRYGRQRSDGYSQDSYRGWAFEEDGTVHGECSSPICADTAETWEALSQVCAILRANNAVGSLRSGGHVHIGVGDYDHSIGQHNDLASAVREHEDVLFRLAQNPARRHHRGLQWCRPGDVPSDGYVDLTALRSDRRRMGHAVALNFDSVAGHPRDHVEFRMWDSSLDPAVIQTQIKLSAGLAHAAVVRPNRSPGRPELLGSHRAANSGHLRLRGEAWHQATLNVRSMLDRVFVRDQDKAQAAALFAITRWQGY